MERVNDALQFPVTRSEAAPKREPRRLPLVDQLLREQRELTAVERFAQEHADSAHNLQEPLYRALLPTSKPASGQQYAFEVNLDVCSGCKACVSACHSLNGLESDETWRSVGLLHGVRAATAKKAEPAAKKLAPPAPSVPAPLTIPMQQTVTSACHHCVEPACLKGCPVQAYEKDPVTGIVKHLDDQCIGCQYCIFACPYEVPQYSAQKGIVRKCDMCTDRLAEGEAPACVQACPSEAIAIRVVDVSEAVARARAEDFLPSAPSPSITTPTTRYVSKEPLPADLQAADLRRVSPWHAHNPLVLMLVLTQLAAGSFAGLCVVPALLSPAAAATLRGHQAVVAILLTLLAIGASTAHLGRPQYAFRALLGLRTSWLSREVAAFGAMAGTGVLYTVLVHRARLPALDALVPPAVAALLPLLGVVVAAVSLAAVFTSVMLYHVTRRSLWHASRTATRFYGTAAVLGTAVSAACTAVSALTSDAGAAPVARALLAALPVLLGAKLYAEARLFAHRDAQPVTALSRSVMLLDGPLRPVWQARVGCAALSAVCALLGAALSGVPLALVVAAALTLLCALAGELCERALFFRAMSSLRMPGGVA